jgi:hypothetical protein
MIKANELRLKNYILYRGSIRSVAAINMQGSYYGMSVSDSNGGVSHAREEEIEGIPLTPEWLERCGFSKGANDDCDDCETYSTAKMDGGIAQEKDGYYLSIIHADGYYKQIVGRKIEYVHHLQNLFFCLTGEELTIKF